MIDVTKGKLVSDVYKFVAYFDATKCIPNMGADGSENLDSSNRYFLSDACVKHKVRKYLQYMGKNVLHIDDPSGEDITIKERLIGSDKIEKYSKDELWKKELEYADIRMFGTLDIAGKMKIRGPVGAPISLMKPTTLNPVEIIEYRGTRSYTVAREENGKNVGSNYNNESWMINYGLFQMYGGVNLSHVKHYGLLESDLDDFFEGLWHMFDFDSSNMRPEGSMRMRKLIVWKFKEALLAKEALLGEKIYDFPIYELDSSISIANDFSDYIYNKPREIDDVTIYIR